ncbi:MAG: phospholipase D-like domain-containing protein [Spirochaetota bacterium]|nr:phospholipase D-like domain-containing protein [Spirochaetota bacterium]
MNFKKYSTISIILSIILLSDIAKVNSREDNFYRIYFTSPWNKGVSRNNPETAIINLISQTKRSFFGAFYDISSKKIAYALQKAHARGVKVKLVVERDNYNKKGMGIIKKAGIPVVKDNKSGYMHNKFAIADKRILWTGSYNLTDNGSYKNNNNAIMILSSDLSNIYLNEFDEMFRYKIFGNKKEKKVFSGLTKKYYVKIGNTNINAYFSPEDSIENIIIKRLKKAKESIHFMVFSFTSDKIGEEMIHQHRKGVKVYGLMEKRGAKSKYSEYIKMKIEGIPVKLDRNRYIMHHKVIVIDKKRVITGSFNFSKNANKKNDENVLIIDNSNISGEYLKEFYRLYRK